jgi:DNA polymerase-3 subunit epsilon
VIHNAEFDMKFINYELKTLGFPSLPMKNVIDTLAIARQKFPGSPANLDALCRRFSIDNSNRTLHGALLDSELLAEVYLELIGGRQHGFSFDASKAAGHKTQNSVMQNAVHTAQAQTKKEIRPVRNLYSLQEEDYKAHQTMVSKLKDALWPQD